MLKAVEVSSDFWSASRPPRWCWSPVSYWVGGRDVKIIGGIVVAFGVIVILVAICRGLGGEALLDLISPPK